MSRKSRLAATTLVALLTVGCGQEDVEPERTDDTNRALLSGTTAGGPFSPADGDADLAATTEWAFLPDLGHNLGSVEAPVKVIEFADFGCGYCRLFHQETLPALVEEFVDTNKIEWKLLQFVSGQFENSLAVTEATECALEQDAEAYRALSTEVWERQSEWKPSDQPAEIVRQWVADLDIEMAEYDDCMASDRRIERIAGATAVARQLGVRGTPTFWIVGFGPLQGALPLDVFRDVLTTVVTEVEAAAELPDDGTAPSN